MSKKVKMIGIAVAILVLALLAAYSTADLTDTELEEVSIYGAADEVLNLAKYERCHGARFPENLRQEIRNRRMMHPHPNGWGCSLFTDPVSSRGHRDRS